MLACLSRVAHELRASFATSRRCKGCTLMARHYRDWQTVAGRPPAFDDQPKASGSGLKVVVENRNVYEGLYLKVAHVVYEGLSASPSSLSPKKIASTMPAWMGTQRAAPNKRRLPLSGRLLA
ncbi:hypothetical protein AB1Y20_016698 [Prymnesium parvum]|uniref:Uncharacterized protein n=1 Tax=Prymnesium parvum TaxID=97485 RepID=A0AB34ID21_PRYPA|mmetsp:Transcript_29491/g.44506  ORF Transcript_29491/g.44506 Transcript_29491/m.44506 type:complete len:122 (+) Transcript_29491:126-491(+)